LKRSLGGTVLAALVLLVACAADVNSAPHDSVDVSALESSSATASRAFARYYQIENTAAANAYVDKMRANGMPTDRAQTCRLATGVLSRRPSVLANPPLSTVAIRQRESAVAAVGAYITAVMAVAEGASADNIAAAIADLRTRATDLQQAARRHDQGDLFIEDVASAFGKGLESLNENSERLQRVRQLRMVDAPVRYLMSVVKADAARQRTATTAAATLAYTVWRSGQHAGAGRDTSRDTEPPFCSEPAIFPQLDSVGSVADAGRPTNPHGARLWSAMNAARGADPVSVLSAMASLDDAEMQLLREPGNDGDAERAGDARKRFEHDAQALAWALRRT